MEFKEVIKNKKGLNVSILVKQPKGAKDLVFLMHGFGGFKELPLLKEVSQAFENNNFIVVSFDATNSIGESGGEMKDGTITSYCNDLEDVINWSKKQEWYQEPFYLIGRSLGGYCISNYAISNNKKIKALGLFSPLVSGKLFIETEEIKKALPEWEKTGIREWESSSSPGIIKKSGYQFIEDSLNHNLLKGAEKIKCPVLFVSGEDDSVIPIKHQKMLLEKIKIQKEFYLIKNADHNLKNKENFQDLRKILETWIKKIK